MDHERNEYELALQAREGDREALAELVERTRLRLFALAYAELRHYDDAQDAVASALLQVCLHVGELREPLLPRIEEPDLVRGQPHLFPIERHRHGLQALVDQERLLRRRQHLDL